MEESANRERLIKRLTRWCIVTAFLLALLWPLGSFVFWILSGTIAYLIFLIFYFSPQKQRKVDDSTNERSTEPIKLKIWIVAIVIIIAGFSMIRVFVFPFQSDSYNSNEPVTEELRNPKADSLVDAGILFHNRQQYDDARNLYDQALAIDARNKYALYNKALSYYSQQDYQQSIKLCYTCLSYHPTYGYANYLLGDNYMSIEKYDSALICLELAYQQGVPDKELAVNLGEVHAKKSNINDAVRYYEEALQQDSTLIDVYERLAELRPNKATTYLQLALKWKKP
jgi:tetratricopeptide (TPR) repeat protein